MATFSRHVASVGNAASYQVSGIPWISGSSMPINDGSADGGADDMPAEIKFEFPRVTKSVTILYAAGAAGTPTNGGGTMHGSTTAGLRIHFNSTGSGNVLSKRHFVELNEINESMTFNVRCKEIYISRAETADGEPIEFRVICDLTNIPAGEMGALTGSGLTE
tara:strand:- start:39 stop:527 length:489 start_codon:yes stop_codon:yes gene_type:complete